MDALPDTVTYVTVGCFCDPLQLLQDLRSVRELCTEPTGLVLAKVVAELDAMSYIGEQAGKLRQKELVELSGKTWTGV